MTYPPTPEQAEILDAARTGDNLVIVAGAGTGKTSTLRMIADALPGRGLYLAYNRAIADDAAASFPRNIQCMTAHAIAYRSIVAGTTRQERLRAGRMPPREQAQVLGVHGPTRVTDQFMAAPWQLMRLVNGTVRNFCNSADLDIAHRHVPKTPGMDDPEYHRQVQAAVLPIARKAWADLAGETGQLPLTHDVYLKVWALTKPQAKVDYILLDEAQDANPVIASIVLGQRSTQQIAVGDSSQAIYCQPVGTLVDVPAPVALRKPHRSRCIVDDCDRFIDHRATSLCDLHEQQRRRGTPFTTIVHQPVQVDVIRVPIETLSVGDKVVTYSNGHVFKRGRSITSVTRLRYSGRLIRVGVANGSNSAYTPEHHCIVRVGAELDGKHAVYLMGRGEQFRVGRAPIRYSSQGNLFGLVARAKAEGADAAWVLSVHDSVADAALTEALTQHRFNLPGVRFEPTSDADVLDVRVFWAKHGANRKEAEACLREHGRLPDFPLWTRASRLGTRRPFVTAAANLFDGLMVLPAGAEIQHNGKRDYAAPAHRWQPVSVTSEWYDGDIVSLEVDDHHTYYADGILTHNSWRGAIDALKNWPAQHRLALSQSWRFGPAIADEANRWLELLDAELRLTGNPARQSILTGMLPDADAVLCRTNGAAMSEAITALKDGRRPAIVGGGDELRKLAEASKQLRERGMTTHPELYAFRSWGEVQDYVAQDEGGRDLRVAVNLIDEHGADTLIGYLDQLAPERSADVVISTSHKAKGREWDRVRIGDDFHPPKDNDDGGPGEPNPEALMLAYVATTRAKLALDRGSLDWIDQHLPGNDRDVVSDISGRT